MLFKRYMFLEEEEEEEKKKKKKMISYGGTKA
jgi:hypothetical protein